MPTQNAWCTYQAVDEATIIVQFVVLTIVTLFLAAIIYYSKKIYKLRKLSKQYQQLFGNVYIFVFSLMFIWSVFSIIKTTINIIMYYKFIKFPHPHQDQPNHILRAFAGVFQMFDSLSAICVILILIRIPYQWISFVIDCVNGNDKNMENMDMKTRKYIMYLHFGLKMIDRYIGFRMLSGIYFVVEAIMLATNDLGHKMTIYNSYFMIAESSGLFIIFIIGSLGIQKLYKNGLLSVIPNAVLNTIGREYFCLIVIQIIRIIYHVFSYVIRWYDYRPDEFCYDKNQKQSQVKRLVLTIAIVFVHMFSSTVIMVIYKPQGYTKNRSLLHTEVGEDTIQ